MPERISEEKRQKLLIRGRKSIVFFCFYMFLLLAAIASKIIFNIEEEKIMPLAAIFVFLLIYGTYLQFSLKCPFCDFRLGLVTRLGIPSICPKCKNQLKERR
jgi:hypothetical protein